VPTAARWLLIGAATAAAALVLDLAGLPSASLFAALLVGIVAALRMPASPDVPLVVFRGAQAVAGVSLGVYVQSASLSAVADAWLPVALVSIGTLALSLAAGVAFARWTTVDRPTASLGMVAGGASGIVGMADELGAEARLVAVMQYLRVLVVVVLTPILVGIAFGHPHGTAGGPSPGDTPVIGDLRDWGLTAASIAAGTLLALGARVPAGSLLAPMIVAAGLSLVLGDDHFDVPALLREPVFAAIGLQVGLRFTPRLLRQAGRLLVPTLLAIAGLLVSCFGLALFLHATGGVSLLDAYLATTPGGLYAVLAAAFGTGADTTFVIAVQTLRLFVMVLLAPVVVRRLVSPRAARRHGPARRSPLPDEAGSTPP
jgi:membrane AbrB-like protein